MKTLLIALLMLPLMAIAEPVSWDNPTTREDGKPLSAEEIAGYRLYWGAVSGDYQNTIIIEGFRSSFLVNFLYGDTYFVMTVIDTEGRESMYSPEHMVNIPKSRPNTVINITVIK